MKAAGFFDKKRSPLSSKFYMVKDYVFNHTVAFI